MHPHRECRKGWTEAAAACHKAGEDQLDDWDDLATDIRLSHEDIEAGRVSSVGEAFANARRQLEQD